MIDHNIIIINQLIKKKQSFLFFQLYSQKIIHQKPPFPSPPSLMLTLHTQPIHPTSHHHQPILFQSNHLFPKLNLPSNPPPPPPHKPSQKLPFNLFLSPTQYNQLLITNGKSIKKYHTPQTIHQHNDGIVTNLQYLNHHIFQLQSQKRSKYRGIRNKQSFNHQNKYLHKPTLSNLPPPKHSFSQHSSQQTYPNHQINNLSKSDQKEKGHTIHYDTLIPNTKKYSYNHNLHHKNSNTIKKDRKSHSSFNKTKYPNKTSTNVQSLLNNSQTKKNPDISHLLIKSLIQFTQQKKAQHFNKLSMKRAKTAKDQYIKLLNHKIRTYNLQNSRRSRGSKSKSKSRSTTKHDVSLQYWDHIKNDVLNSLKNDNYSHFLKEKLMDYNFNVYNHTQVPSRKPTKPHRSAEKMDKIRIIRGMQAKRSLELKSKQKQSTEHRLKQNLRSLDKQRKKRIALNPKKPFRPTADLIHGAFKNIVDTSVYQKEQRHIRQAQNKSSVFNNSGIKVNMSNKRQNGRK